MSHRSVNLKPGSGDVPGVREEAGAGLTAADYPRNSKKLVARSAPKDFSMYLMYTISTMHCMTVSLAQNGEGLGAMWGEEKTRPYF